MPVLKRATSLHWLCYEARDRRRKTQEENEATEKKEDHLLLGVGIVGDVDEITNFRGENLLDLHIRNVAWWKLSTFHWKVEIFS